MLMATLDDGTIFIGLNAADVQRLQGGEGLSFGALTARPILVAYEQTDAALVAGLESAGAIVTVKGIPPAEFAGKTPKGGH